MKFRIYTDTSVLGGCEDEEFAEYSIRLMESFTRGDLVLVLSNLTVQELTLAPIQVRKRLATIPDAHIERVCQVVCVTDYCVGTLPSKKIAN